METREQASGAESRRQWKTSAELPAYKKLRMRFDIERLQSDCRFVESQLGYNGYELQSELIKTHAPGEAGEGLRRDLSSKSYVTLSLTEFDENYSLKERLEKSGSIWDRYVFKKDAKLDERFYRKAILNLPAYFTHVLATIPGVHRVRLAKLHAGCVTEKHIDYDTLYSVRLLIPIFTQPGCLNSTRLPDGTVETIEMPADGSCYFTNQGLLHWAENNSDRDRTFLALSVDSQHVLNL